jgi:hypothetical protein
VYVCVRALALALACVRASPLSGMSLVSNFRTVTMFVITELPSAPHIGLYNTNQRHAQFSELIFNLFSPTCFESRGFILRETVVYAVWHVLHGSV